MLSEPLLHVCIYSMHPHTHVTISYFALAHLTLATICDELGEVIYKWKKIGVQLRIPHHKLMEFKNREDPLIDLVNYWLKGNVEGVPVTWMSLVGALNSRFVRETGLANRIKKKYCQQEEEEEEG